eukprot:2413419-Rhodomonas_salina.2
MAIRYFLATQSTNTKKISHGTRCLSGYTGTRYTRQEHGTRCSSVRVLPGTRASLDHAAPKFEDSLWH